MHAVKNAFTLPSGQVLKNRLVKSAMSEQLADRNRNPSEKLVRLYDTWAKGGAGLLISGNIMIDRGHLGEIRNVVMDDDSDLGLFSRWVAAATADGTQFWAQLNHPGKQTPNFLTKEPVAPSAIPLGNGLESSFNRPRALAEAEILDIVGKFARSASLARQVGFTGVQIHGAHGYLVGQFLSPAHNRRDDRWGGSLENRMRFVLETYRAMRIAVGPDFPIGIKLNSADFQKGGFSEDESMQVVEALSAAGIDLIEISGGTYERPAMIGAVRAESTVEREAYFLAYAENVRKRASVPLAVTGGFRSGAGIEAALSSGATDFVGLARPLALDPSFPRRLLDDPTHRMVLPEVTTGFKAIDRLTFLSITWFEHQLERMGRGMSPHPGLGAWRSVLKTFMDLGAHALRKRRA